MARAGALRRAARVPITTILGGRRDALACRAMSSMLATARGRAAAAAAAAAIAAAAALALYIRSRSRADLALDVDDQPVRSVLDTAPASAAPASATASAAGEAEKASDEELREQAKRAKERGNKRFQGRQFQRAIEEYTEAINISPDKSHKDVSVFFGNRAQCFASLDKHAEAEADCDAALAIAPDYVKALCRRAIAREKQGKLEGALLDLTAASLLSGFTNEVAVTGADRVLKLVAQSKAERRLDEPMRHLPSASFISTFVDSFKLHRTLLGKPRWSRPQHARGEALACPRRMDGSAHQLAHVRALLNPT